MLIAVFVLGLVVVAGSCCCSPCLLLLIGDWCCSYCCLRSWCWFVLFVIWWLLNAAVARGPAVGS